MNGRIAVVLFNLGGPDGPEAVKPFLENLFSDPAIIDLPGVVRGPLARLIAARREKPAQDNYALMGGGSPLLPETQRQAEALEAVLAEDGLRAKVFIAMRYWAPLVEETAREVAAFAPEAVVLLPLYPQFSTTTTASSLKAWRESYRGPGTVSTVCCYPQGSGWVEAAVRAIHVKLKEAGDRPVRVLFSAHGVPEKVIRRRDDPYQAQIEAGAEAIARAAGLEDWKVCYQSRVGPMKWLGPSTPEALAEAAGDGVGVVIFPIAFVSEHIETLVELDMEYAHLARTLGLSPYLRAATPGVDPAFIRGLAQAVKGAIAGGGTAPDGPGCGRAHQACPRQEVLS